MTAPFAIILPVRNGGTYVGQAIGSIVEQSDADFRLIVLENASEDDTLAVVQSFDDRRIHVLPAARALSIEENWARAKDVLAELPGETLATFLGHDDYLYPTFVERMRALAEDDPGATLLQCHFDLIDASGALIRPCRPIPERETWADLASAIAWGLRDAYGTGFVFRARDYLAVGGMPPLPGILYADHLLFMRLARLGHKRTDPMTGCAYRLHATSMSNTLSVRRTNERLAAFSGFIAAIEDEFADLAGDDRGQAALLTLLARELLIFGEPIVRGSLNAMNRERLHRLSRRLVELGGTADLHHWSYQASRGQRSVGRARRVLAYARARWRG